MPDMKISPHQQPPPAPDGHRKNAVFGPVCRQHLIEPERGNRFAAVDHAETGQPARLAKS
jgi:hypothetical protein